MRMTMKKTALTALTLIAVGLPSGAAWAASDEPVEDRGSVTMMGAGVGQARSMMSATPDGPMSPTQDCDDHAGSQEMRGRGSSGAEGMRRHRERFTEGPDHVVGAGHMGHAAMWDGAGDQRS